MARAITHFLLPMLKLVRTSNKLALARLFGCRRWQSEAAFPCLDRVEQRTQNILANGPEPVYAARNTGYEVYKHPHRVELDYGTHLDGVEIAYETWGTLNAAKSNAILLHTGLSASSHARSHPKNTNSGWWEKFIGPGLMLDTNKFFVICTNVLGGCYGSTGPSSFIAGTNQRYGSHFPVITIQDMIKVQGDLIRDHLGISKLHASVGSSMGGMQSLAFATEFPDRVGRVASISGCARSHPSSIASRFAQRQILMNDPHWNRGFYYDGVPPHQGMKLAREVATITYRSGPEWEQRFARDRLNPDMVPALCPDFLIETYLDHQGEKFCLQYDPNSLLYLSKAMDMFDLGLESRLARQRIAARVKQEQENTQKQDSEACQAVPTRPIKPQARSALNQSSNDDLVKGMQPMAHLPVFVLGVESDALFPSWQQREIYEILTKADPLNTKIEHHELGFHKSLYGHDTFLLDLENVGKPLKAFLEA